MAKVQVHTEAPTASQAIIKAANEVVIITDENGREIGIKRLGAVERFEMLELIGGGNEHAMGYGALAFHVVSVAGEPVQKPTNRIQLKAAIQRLGDEGMNAVAVGINEHFNPNKVIGTDDIKK
jgi:hypothetical protein